MPSPVDGWTVVLAAAERLRAAGYTVVLDGDNIGAAKAAGDALLAAAAIEPAPPRSSGDGAAMYARDLRKRGRVGGPGEGGSGAAVAVREPGRRRGAARDVGTAAPLPGGAQGPVVSYVDSRYAENRLRGKVFCATSAADPAG